MLMILASDGGTGGPETIILSSSGVGGGGIGFAGVGRGRRGSELNFDGNGG